MAEEHKGALSRHAKPKAHHESGGTGHTHIHYHHHDGGVSGHVMHPDGTHEIHHFDHGDHGSMAALLQEHMGAPGGAAGPGAGAGGPEEPPEHMAQGASPEEEQAEQAA